jgi:vacuolar-type H+-ATPase subunit F/Vma7
MDRYDLVVVKRQLILDFLNKAPGCNTTHVAKAIGKTVTETDRLLASMSGLREVEKHKGSPRFTYSALVLTTKPASKMRKDVQESGRCGGRPKVVFVPSVKKKSTSGKYIKGRLVHIADHDAAVMVGGGGGQGGDYYPRMRSCMGYEI